METHRSLPDISVASLLTVLLTVLAWSVIISQTVGYLAVYVFPFFGFEPSVFFPFFGFEPSVFSGMILLLSAVSAAVYLRSGGSLEFLGKLVGTALVIQILVGLSAFGVFGEGLSPGTLISAVGIGVYVFGSYAVALYLVHRYGVYSGVDLRRRTVT
ncbi:MAG: hypothetical protein SV253_06065 [Halobacteria archaeon]|nr:hypothetical protein [Halobacteria archaeon]